MGQNTVVLPSKYWLTHERAVLYGQVLRADAFKQTYSWMLQEPARSLIKPELVWQIEKGVRQSAEEVAAAKAGHAAYVDRLFAFLGEHELLLIPTCMVAPFDVDIRCGGGRSQPSRTPLSVFGSSRPRASSVQMSCC